MSTQKKYLEKYLKLGKKSSTLKKKKKYRVKIIDDNLIDKPDIEDINDESIFNNNDSNENDPQIVEIIDERPPSLRINEQTKECLWKPVGDYNIGKTPVSKESKEILSKEKDTLSKKIKLEKDENEDRSTTPIKRKIRKNKDDSKPKKLSEKGQINYKKWNKGIIQIEKQIEKKQEELYEMTKPLAREADDKDLDNYLKSQLRAEDPMLRYIKAKKLKKAIENGESIKPEYQGDFLPNRYSIKPGNRWDGVNRSNGYEKKWFESQNKLMAQSEESYKWNIEDM